MRRRRQRDQTESSGGESSDDGAGGRKHRRTRRDGPRGIRGEERSRRNMQDKDEADEADSETDALVGGGKKAGGKKAGAKRRRKRPIGGGADGSALVLNIDPTDLMDGDPIAFGERVRFLLDQAGLGSANMTIGDAHRNGYVYVEGKHGTFSRVGSRQYARRMDLLRDELKGRGRGGDGDPTSEMALRTGIQSTVAGVFQACQGLLAGFSLLHLTLTLQPLAEPVLYGMYADMAMETRRAFFILTTVAFTGALDRITRESDTVVGARGQEGGGAKGKGGGGVGGNKGGTNRTADLHQRTLVDIVIECFIQIVYAAALLFSLLTMHYEDYFHYSKTDTEAMDRFFPNITSAAPAGSSIIPDWQLLSTIRSVCCILGWVAISGSIYQERLVARRVETRILDTELDLDDTSRELNHVLGLSLHDLDDEALQTLLDKQQGAVERVQRTMLVREQQHHKQLQQAAAMAAGGGEPPPTGSPRLSDGTTPMATPRAPIQ